MIIDYDMDRGDVLASVCFREGILRLSLTATSRQELVMNDCCPVSNWVTGKPTLATGGNRAHCSPLCEAKKSESLF